MSSDVEALVRYHHTPESALPQTFILASPMWRIFKLIDGLSAGITRREATVLKIRVNASETHGITEPILSRFTVTENVPLSPK